MDVDIQGTIDNNVTGDVDAQFSPWYVDDDNFLTIDVEWRSWDRSHEIRRLHVYGKFAGESYNSGDIWADNPSNNTKPAGLVHLAVSLEAGKLSFVATCAAEPSWNKSFTLENAGIVLDSYLVAFGAYGDKFTFSNINIVPIAPAEPTAYATFNCGDDGEAKHVDGDSTAIYTGLSAEGYTLTITDGANLFKNARDAQGNGCLKLGTGKAVGSFKLTVTANVTKVVFMVAGYKSTAAKISINGGEAIEVTSKSDEGEYTAIEAVPVDNEITFTTLSGGYRCMINTIVYYA